MTTPHFSVLLSIYEKEHNNHLKASLQSIINQTLMPSEIVLVKDGPLTDDLNSTIDMFVNLYPNLIKIIPLKENLGLGKALNIGLKECSYEIVARMDTDDIASPNRFQKQISFLSVHDNIDVLGSHIQEFVSDPLKPSGWRIVPESHDQVVRQSKWKNPMNHMTIVFRKSSVIKSGGYQHFPGFEDYHLWIRMIQHGYRFYNLQESLIFARVGNDMVGRRHGYNYLKHELKFIKWMLDTNYINRFQKYKMTCTRTIARLIPKKVLQLIYSKLNRG